MQKNSDENKKEKVIIAYKKGVVMKLEKLKKSIIQKPPIQLTGRSTTYYRPQKEN